MEHPHVDPTAPGRLLYPEPALCHRNYPMYTPGGLDRRWANEFELKRSDVKWVGNMMYDIRLEGHRGVALTCIVFQVGGSARRTTYDGAMVSITPITRLRSCGWTRPKSIRVAVLGGSERDSAVVR